MTANTIDDFIKTRDMLPIYCPACGAKMTLHNPATYEMQLTDNARREIDKILQEYRIFLTAIERNLRLRNRGETKKISLAKQYDLKPTSEADIQQMVEGLFNPEGFTEFIYGKFDPLEIEQQIDILPTLEELSGQDKEKKGNAVVQFLMHFVELGSLIDPIISLLFEQDDLLTWRQSKAVKVDKDGLTSPLLTGGIESNFWLQYLNEVTKIIFTVSAQPTPAQRDLEERIIRSVYLLVLMLGHDYSNLIQDMPDIFVGGAAYDLPRRVTVSASRLDELLRSKVILYMRKKFALNKEFVDQISASEDDGEASIDEQTSLKESSKLVKFTCVGSSTVLLESTKMPDSGAKCGWYPKDEQTHSVVLLGSPGTGKSTVMETGLTILRLISSGMGINLIPLSIDEYALNARYTTDFWSGILPNPTELNTRSSIQFRTESTFTEGEQTRKSYFVFTDIPGETAIRHLLDSTKPMHPYITSVLSSTETIVFFFDFTADPEIRNMLLNSDGSDDKGWKSIADHVQDTKAPRNGSQTGTPQKAAHTTTGNPIHEHHKVDIVQTDLMMTFIHELREIRGDDLKGISFLCVFPKMDLFVDTEELNDKKGSNTKSKRFLTPFYKYLIESGILTEPISSNSQSENEEKFARTSIGIYGLKDNTNNPNGELMLQKQRDQAHEISRKAIEALSDIGNALGETKSSAGWKNALSSKIRQGVIETLKTHFGEDNVYFLPISPQGAEYRLDDIKQSDGIKKIKHPPYQKLSEYVLGIPVILATLQDWYPEEE